jgi:LPXTG-motif cell wall-anchored protein
MDIKKLAFGGLAVAAGLTLTLSATPAMAVTSTHTFKVDTMTITNSASIDADGTSGDDGGYLAVTTDVLLRDGDDEVHTYNKTTLAAIASSDVDNNNELFSDLATETAYEFVLGGDGFTGAIELDADGNETATEFAFSETIPTENGDEWVAGNGAGQVAFWNGTTGDIWVVSLPSGTVTKVTGKSLFADFDVPPADNSESSSSLWQAGILEFDCTNYNFLLLDDGDGADNATRFNTADATSEIVLAAGADDDTDIDTLMVSPSDSRWYAHSEGTTTTVFGIDTEGDDEPIVTADATFTTESICADALPDTGVSENSGIWAASAALIAGLGVAGVFMARRRQA